MEAVLALGNLHRRNFFLNVLCLLEFTFSAAKTLGRHGTDIGFLAVGNVTEVRVAAPTRHLVVARYDEDVSWLRQLPANFDAVVYQSKNMSAPNYVENYGNEALKYLEYIVNEYDNLPDVMTFVHASRHDWHDPLPKEVYLPKADARAAIDGGGFSFLPGGKTCWYVDLASDTDVIPPLGARDCIDLVRASPEEGDVLRELWQNVLQSELGSPPKAWQTACCAQFQVTRSAIHRHSQKFYTSLSDWVRYHDEKLYAEDSDDNSGTSGKSFLAIAVSSAPAYHHHDPLERDAGHVMEVIWPLLFSDKPRGAESAPEWRAPPP